MRGRADPAVFVLGNQKAGTSVIAGLLAAHLGVEATIDLKREIREQLIYRVLDGDCSVEALVKSNVADFAKPVVKHPNLTLIYPQLRNHFPSSRFVFVVRDPRHNLRSILDRLGLPGSGQPLTSDVLAGLPEAWQRMLLGAGLNGRYTDHIAALADRWSLMVGRYQEFENETVLVKYEDFLDDKATVIARLAERLDMAGRQGIDAMVDHQFQTRGANRGVDPARFFSVEALTTIESRCADGMVAVGYGSGGSE